ncbi:hypothetical protein CBM2588_P360007 [Cupriavidus taiwanensis]|nr:hypothetical protein CBM2588_P360007 [Cupriavidus taiwanensis]
MRLRLVDKFSKVSLFHAPHARWLDDSFQAHLLANFCRASLTSSFASHPSLQNTTLTRGKKMQSFANLILNSISNNHGDLKI